MIEAEDIDVYAAEYVLGTLNRAERIEVATIRATDTKMAAAIDAWERRFEPLNMTIPEETPSPAVLDAIQHRILTLKAIHSAPPLPSNRPRRLQALVLAVSLAFVIVTGLRHFQTPEIPAVSPYVAVLRKDDIPLFVVGLNDTATKLNVRSSGNAPVNKSYELWLIVDGESTPRPLGVLDALQSNLEVPKGLEAESVKSSTLAVSVEPHGGSPTGIPTGPVIVTGKFAHNS